MDLSLCGQFKVSLEDLIDVDTLHDTINNPHLITTLKFTFLRWERGYWKQIITVNKINNQHVLGIFLLLNSSKTTLNLRMWKDLRNFQPELKHQQRIGRHTSSLSLSKIHRFWTKPSGDIRSLNLKISPRLILQRIGKIINTQSFLRHLILLF